MIASYRLVLLVVFLFGALDVKAQDSNPYVPLNAALDGWYSFDFTDPSLLAGVSDHETTFGKNLRYSVPPRSDGVFLIDVRRCMNEPFAIGDVQGTRCHGVENLQGATSIWLQEFAIGFSEFSLDFFFSNTIAGSVSKFAPARAVGCHW